MPHHTLFVCVLCRSSQPQSELSAGQTLFDRLDDALQTCDWHDSMRLRPVRCMGSCNRSCVAAFAAPGKLTFVLNHLSPQSVPDLLQFSQQYIAANNGNVPYKDRSTTIKQGLMVVLPSPVEE